jgi:signal transduction histidine kinase
VLYVALAASILFLSSEITRSLFSSRLDVRFHDFEAQTVTQPLPPPPPTSDTVRADLQGIIWLVNGILLLISAFLSYWLAGLTLRPIQRAYEKQRDFLGDASHELRTPLAILRTQFENAKHDARGADERQRIDDGLEEVDRMTRLVGDLLTLSRLDRVSEPEVRESINVLPVLLQSIERLRGIASAHDVVLTANIPKNISLHVLATNQESVARVFVNLLHNAILYNVPKGSVDVDVRYDEKTVTFEIKDTGIGMTPEELPRASERFYRAEKSRSRKTGGSGLGLSIVSGILHAIGGSLNMQSTSGKGTTVRVTLPRA